MFFIEHSVSSLHGTLTNVDLTREGHLQMQNAQHDGYKKKHYSTNRFNDSEYKRWSEGLKASGSCKTQWGIDSFVGTNENLQPGCEDVSPSAMKIGEKVTKAGTSMFWKPREWKRAAKQLRNRCRLLVEEFCSAVAKEETRFVRMELGKLARGAKSRWGC
jgi:hypothetical protein